jgi:type IV secretion system protein VirB4
MFDKVKEYLDNKEQAKLAERDKQKDNTQREDSVVHKFIPYACYYNKDTLLTKDGQLLQGIRIQGLSYDISGGDDSLRDSLVNFVFKNVPSNKFSFYLHTIRRRRNFDDKPVFKESFAQEVHSAWVDSNNWDNGFVNDLYMTIIHAGTSINVTAANFVKYFSFSSLVKSHDEALQEAHRELASFTKTVVERLSGYNPAVLGLEKDDKGEYSSSLLKFFCKIVHLDDVNLPVVASDLSKQMGEYKIAFGNNALEVKKDGKKLFASILSMKEYNQLSKIGINKILLLPQEMVITQTVNFIDAKQVRQKLEYQRYVLVDITRSSSLTEASGLEEAFLGSVSSTMFCKSQITVMAMSKSLEQLDVDVQNIYDSMSNLGIPVVKEDLRMEGCFWSQLPGNFVHIQRQFDLHYSCIGGFSVLGGFPFGNLRGVWGSYICLFKTIFGTPYFFNFHVGNNGHSIIVGDYAEDKALLMNFLILESLKFNPKVIYIDTNKASKVFFALLGGKYLEFALDSKSFALNPLLLEDRSENRSFIEHWFILLIDKYMILDSKDKYMGPIKSAVNKIFELPREKRLLNNVKEFFVDPGFKKENQEILAMLAPWCKGGGVMENVFNCDHDDLFDAISSNNICAIDLTELLEVPMLTQLPIFLYILHCFRVYCTGNKPSIFALTDGNKMMHSIYFVKNLESILDDLMLNNAVFITTSSFYSEVVNWNEKVAAVFVKKIANKFFMASHSASYGNVKSLFGLSAQDFVYLQSFSNGDNRFLLRHNNLSVLSSVNFSNQYFANSAILSKSYLFQKQFDELSVKYNNKTDKFLPLLQDYIKKHG